MDDTKEKFRNLMAQKRSNGEPSCNTNTANMQVVRSYSTGDILNAEHRTGNPGEMDQCGEPGSSTDPSLQGENGTNMSSSEAGVNGPNGSNGVNRPNGANGANVANGANGSNGSNGSVNGNNQPQQQGGGSGQTQGGAPPTFIIQDDNEMFCLSLVPVLRSLSPKKNLSVRIKILTLIADEGGGGEDDMV